MQESRARNLDGTIESDSKVKCYLEEHVWHKMMGWCKAAKSEVSGMGLCKIVKGSFVVYEVFFPLQYGSSGYTELDDRALAKLQIGLYNKKIPADHFRFWWHTHYNFNVFWSGTDDNNATTLAKANGQWELSLVINQASEFRCRADFFKKVHPMVPEPVHVLIDNIEVFTCPNSKRQRRKPHYKSDVKRWVKDMSELPEKQKPKFNQCTTVNEYQGYDYAASDRSKPSYAGEFGNWFGERYGEWGEVEEYCTKCASRFCINGSICEGKLARGERGSESKPKEKKYHELENGDDYGGYVWYNGFLLDPKDYKAKMATREETIEEMAERVGKEMESRETKLTAPCICGDEACNSYDLCVHCDLCGGRCQAATGYCPGCWDYYQGVDKLAKSAIN